MSSFRPTFHFAICWCSPPSYSQRLLLGVGGLESTPTYTMEERLVPESHRLQDFDFWLRLNALPVDESVLPSTLQREASDRVRQESEYEENLHRRFFSDLDQKMRQQEANKEACLKSWELIQIYFQTRDGMFGPVRLPPLARSCDTIFTWASSWRSSTRDATFRLVEFPREAVARFVRVADGDVAIHEIDPQYIVDCCRMAHYLQNQSMLSDIVQILLESVDTANCYSLCQLADELNLPVLFERSLSHMMDRIADLQQEEASEYLTPELRDRINSIKGAIQTSIHCQSRLYFGSLDEYLAIFAERVQYYKERLAEAKEQQMLEEKGTRYWVDVQSKIDHQEKRVRTLETVFREQKLMFTPAAPTGGSA